MDGVPWGAADVQCLVKMLCHRVESRGVAFCNIQCMDDSRVAEFEALLQLLLICTFYGYAGAKQTLLAQ